MKLMPSHTHASFHLRSLSFALVGLSLGGCIGADESTGDAEQRENVEEAQQEVVGGNLNVPADMARATVQIIAGNDTCTAIRVGPRTLVTAAHCVMDNTTMRPSYQPGSGYFFGLRVVPWWPVSIVQWLTMKVSATHVHPGWHGNLGNDPDIALIEIDPASPGISAFDVYTTQRKLNIGYTPNAGRSLIMGGWGYTEGAASGPKDYPHFGPTTIDWTNTNYIRVLGPSLKPGNASMAHGDSGGPMYDNEGGAGGTWGSVVAINSVLDNVGNTLPAVNSHHTRLDSWQVRDWLMGFASKLDIEGKGKIRGYIDGISISGTTRYVNGWACDYGVGQSIDVHVYGNGAYPAGTLIGYAVANRPTEAAVSNLCGTSGVAHRFSAPVSAAHAGKSVWVHGISKSGSFNLLIDRSGALTLP